MYEPFIPVPPPRSERDHDEFYIGYAPPMPPNIARMVKRIVIALGIGTVAAAGGLAIGHTRLEGGVFDFGHPRMLSGVIIERPYPALRHERDGRDGWSLLVAPGKHGANALVHGLDGQRLTFAGTRIERGEHAMFEIDPTSLASGSSAAVTTPAASEPLAEPGATLTLRGEIVDSKCFLGVMVPGEGTTHKACASLCMRGGIPPALLVRDREGRSELLLLVSAKDEPVSAEAAALAGEPVEMTGVTARRGNWLMLRTDPSTWRPLAARRP